MNRVSRIRALELSLLDAWPATERVHHDGWALLANGGHTGRANAATVLIPSAAPIDEAVDFAEAWYTARAQPTMVRVTPLAGPALTSELLRQQYVPRTGACDVMVRTLRAPERPGAAGMELSSRPDTGWWALTGRALPEQATLNDMLSRLGDNVVFACLRVDDAIVAVGQAVTARGYVHVFAMNTATHARRRGYDRLVMGELEAWGHRKGAHSATLQVVIDNQPAQLLYLGRGYEPVYRYHYLVATDMSRVRMRLS